MLVLILIVILFNGMTPIEMLTTTLFAMFLQLITDTYLDLKYDLYGYFRRLGEFHLYFGNLSDD